MIFFQIDELKKLVDLFSETQCDFLSENCIVALEKRDHNTGCILEVIGQNKRKIQLKWSKEFRRAGYQDPNK